MPASAVIPIAASEVPVATLPSKLEHEDQQRDDDDAAADAEEGAEEARDESYGDELQRHRSYPRGVDGDGSLLARIAEAPDRTAILLDVDGVLAPIVEIPHEAVVPEETRLEVARLHERYALVACISGRSGADARRIVGLDQLVYVGEHGLELVPEAADWSERLHALRGDGRLGGRRAQAAHRHVPLPPRRGRKRGAEDARGGRGARPARGARYRGSAARCWSCDRPWAPTREPQSPTCSASAGSNERSTQGTTRPTSTPSTRSRGWSSACGWRSRRPEGPAELREAADIVVGGPAEFVEVLRLL